MNPFIPGSCNDGWSLSASVLKDHGSYVLGHEAMQKMSSSDVLLIGLGGLGLEIGKQMT